VNSYHCRWQAAVEHCAPGGDGGERAAMARPASAIDMDRSASTFLAQVVAVFARSRAAGRVRASTVSRA
jgi:hypothetical protein